MILVVNYVIQGFFENFDSPHELTIIPMKTKGGKIVRLIDMK